MQTTTVGSPQRIQRKRTKGWKMPENTVYVGRPGRWGNPFVLTSGSSAKMRHLIVGFFRQWLENDDDAADLRKDISLLRGKNLACWCPAGQPCHADVLLELANKQDSKP